MEEEIYRENVMDHYRCPRNKSSLAECTVKKQAFNPLCGDEITVYIQVEGTKLKEVTFTGEGCAISQAAISMLTEKIKGMSIEEVKKLDKEDILELLGIKISYQRTKCALLSLKVVHQGLASIGVENE
tara:strand:+ start:322 stop:705 length:384 start_codon:yes stop_codon:yes gene_type:complete